MIPRYLRIVFCIMLCVMSSVTSVRAQSLDEKVRVAVIVGDTAITTYDIRNRVNLALFSSGLSPDNAVVQRLIPRVVNLLIDEQLYKQEAARLNIVVSDQELENAKRSIEQKNGLEPGGLAHYITSKGVYFPALEQQLHAQILLNKLIQRRIRPRVTVTDKEIAEKLENIAHRAGVMEYELSEIVLPLGDNNDSDTAALMEQLLREIENGANFQSVAREFSQGVTAKSGGDLGWVTLADLPKPVATAVRNLEAGMVSEPIRTTDNYYVMRLNNTRTLVVPDTTESEIGIKQAFVFFENEDATAQKAQAEHLQQQKEVIDSCDSFDDFAQDVDSEVDSKMVMTQYRSLNDDIREALQPLAVGEVSPVIKSAKGLHVFMVCEKTEAVASLAEKRKVKDALFAQKVSLQSKRYLRNLRRNAFIDIRI